jgi:hypothetical protein
MKNVNVINDSFKKSFTKRNFYKTNELLKYISLLIVYFLFKACYAN